MKKVPLTEDNFDERYKPILNPFDSNAPFNGCMLETYGEELEYAFKVAKESKRVWTILEAEGNMYYAAGFHYVNRLGFLVCEVEYETGTEEVALEGVEDSE